MTSEVLPDLKPWFNEETDIYEELPPQEDFFYDL